MYDNDIDYWVHIVGPSSTRLVFIFQAVDLEYQKDCLYDFVEVSPQLGTYLNLKITRDLFISSKWTKWYLIWISDLISFKENEFSDY